jgi:hypothetical protein
MYCTCSDLKVIRFITVSYVTRSFKYGVSLQYSDHLHELSLLI